MSQKVTLIGKIVVRSGAAKDVAAILLRLAAASRKETGCTRYEVVQDIGDSNVFALIEEWANAEALDRHNETAHVREALSAAGPLLAQAPELGRYRTLG
jgi:quinol monooxygenase YgiN